MTGVFKPVTTRRTFEEAVEQIAEKVKAGELQVGQRLPSERELGDKFGVSRTVVREAVRSLAARGLVRVTSGRGVEVNAFGAGNVAASMQLLVRGHDSLDYGKVNEVRSAVEVRVFSSSPFAIRMPALSGN